MLQRKKLPIGIQTFRDIRDPKENYAYIDKTAIAYRLICEGKYYFLSRPRRFGKSLFLDTLAEIFKGNKSLFNGLAIYDKWDWTNTFPVLRISFAIGDFSSKSGIEFRIQSLLQEICADHGISIESEKFVQGSDYFRKVIRALYAEKQQKLVILIDEYDKPILDTIHLDDKTVATTARSVLREFYSVIKESDEFLRFVFITGVSKFSKLNLFSGLNNIEDITIDANYATITGYTQHDLESQFSDRLLGVDLHEVKRWYNGYNYFGESIYNPFDILLFFSKNCQFDNYWWQTGNPSFLIEILKKGQYFLPELQNIEVTEETLNAFDVEAIDIVALLWQTGYLTFDNKLVEAGFTSYKMKIPNVEVQRSLNTLFTQYLTAITTTLTKHQLIGLRSLLSNDLKGIETALRALFSSIPYSNYTNNPISQFEGYYASVVYTYLASLGFDIIPEDITNLGRIDLTIKTNFRVYIFEFKVDMPTEAALHQIKAKRYYEKYSDKECVLIGIHFDSALRNISGFESEDIQSKKTAASL